MNAAEELRLGGDMKNKKIKWEENGDYYVLHILPDTEWRCSKNGRYIPKSFVNLPTKAKMEIKRKELNGIKSCKKKP